MPPLVTWNDSCSVKVKLCDQQHQKLFAIIDELADAMRTGKSSAVVSHTVSELLLCTRTHFQQEEALLRKANYPLLGSHQEMHRQFMAVVESLDRQAREGHTPSSVEVLTMLRNWLLTHIRKMDMAYTAHLNAAGIR
jgi:hemerythrin-like metal-binding protein